MIEKFYEIIGNIQDWYDDFLDWIDQVLAFDIEDNEDF